MLFLFLSAITFAFAVTVPDKQPKDTGRPSSPIRAAIRSNFPDPAIWYANGIWYAYATNSGAGVLGLSPEANMSIITPGFGIANVQMATSTDFITWNTVSVTHDPLPQTGSWATQPLPRLSSPSETSPWQPPGLTSAVWAPSILHRPLDNRYILYYTATSNSTNPQPQHPSPHCIGAALSEPNSPTGPFIPLPTPLACPVEQGGAIDPEAFLDPADGTIYTLWKVDGNNFGHGGACGNTVEPVVGTPIMLMRMDADGVNPAKTPGGGEEEGPVEILDRIEEDGPLVEAPVLVKSDEGVYFLFFSSGCTRDDSYAVKYATARNVFGPYTRAKEALLKTGDWGLEAPGSVGVHGDGERGYFMAFHARVRDGDQGEVRAMFTTRLRFEGDVVVMVKDYDSSGSR